jgi:hypothetical protein
MTLHYPPNEPARSTIDETIARKLEQSGYSLRHAPVLCWRLDDAVRELKLPAPDLIKIDAEGAEEMILRGAEQTLRQYTPTLYIELHGTKDEVFRVLSEYQYDAEMLDALHVLAKPVNNRKLGAA